MCTAMRKCPEECNKTSDRMTVGKFMDSIILNGKEAVKGCKSKGVEQRIPHCLPYGYSDL